MAEDWLEVWRIVDGDRYEVNDKGGVWSPGQKKRAGPIPEIRIRTRGIVWGPGYRAFLPLADKDAAACVGVFYKFLEIAASQPVHLRWLILDNEAQPWSPQEMAILLGFQERDIVRALEALSAPQVSWIERVRWNPRSGDIREIPGNSRKSRNSLFRTVQDSSVQDSTGQEDVATSSVPCSDLLDRLIDLWNTLPAPVRRVQKRRSADIVKAWKAVRRCPERRPHFDEPEAIIQKIREQPWLHDQSWFCFAWLLKREKDGSEFNVCKVMEERYGQEERAAGQSPVDISEMDLS